VSFYLDANVIVALLTDEPLSARADAFLRAKPEQLIVSDFAAAEFSSAISRRVRTGETPLSDARIALSGLDVWLERSAIRIEIAATDVALADTFLRRLDLTLLTPDALHIAMAHRADATMVTFDRQMAVSARALGASVAHPDGLPRHRRGA
jgi:predicted nucleic acid-binding protein